jgi:hypothetical protein
MSTREKQFLYHPSARKYKNLMVCYMDDDDSEVGIFETFLSMTIIYNRNVDNNKKCSFFLSTHKHTTMSGMGCRPLQTESIIHHMYIEDV